MNKCSRCNELTDIIEQYKKWVKHYKKQLDQLKKQHEGDKGLITSTGKMNYQLLQEYDKLKSENKHLNDLLNQALKDYEKTKDTLTEIKEIANDFYLDGEYCKVESLALEILRKISEVTNDMEND